MSEDSPAVEMKADLENLYREESYTDLKVAQIRRLIPVNPDGSNDDSRSEVYVGETQLMSPRGPVPIHCPIEAASIQDAFDKFPDAVNVAVEKLIEEAKEIQRQESSRIVVPGMGGQGDIGGMGGGPGGKITLR